MNIKHRLLSVSWIYAAFRNLVVTARGREWLIRGVWRMNEARKIVDIGCGPGVLARYLPEGVAYVGFDVSPAYIATAQQRFKGVGIFLVGTAREFLDRPDERLYGADLVICNGVLHHLDDDEVTGVLRLAKEIMTPNGRLVCVENSFLIYQGHISRWLIAADRGGHLRGEAEWKRLVGRVFDRYTTNIATGLLRIPYVHIVIECWK